MESNAKENAAMGAKLIAISAASLATGVGLLAASVIAGVSKLAGKKSDKGPIIVEERE